MEAPFALGEMLFTKKVQNVDSEHVSKTFTNNVFYLLSAKISNLAIEYLLISTTAIFHLLMVMFRHLLG